MSSEIENPIFDKVIFVGPDIDAKGGMASVLRSYRDNFAPFHYLRTNSHRGTAAGLCVLAVSLLRLPLERLKGRKILHIHYASGKSWTRKQFVARVGRMLGFRTVMHCHSAEMKKTVARMGASRVRRTLDKADANVVLSDSWKEFFADGIGCRNIHKINNIVNRETMRSSHDSETARFVFIGEVCQRKGVYDLVEAMSVLKKQGVKAMLKICGNGESDRLEQKIRELDVCDTVEYVGWINPEQRRTILSESDVLVLPSYAEGLPISLLEAMAQELAVVSTPVGGIPEIVSDNVNGFLVEPGNAQALAEAMSGYADNPELAAEHGRNGTRTVSAFYPDKVAGELINLYSELL